MSIDEIYSRRSIRKFKKKEVEREKICEMIKAAIAAPSAKNRQPWKYIVFTGDKKDELLNAMETGLINEKEKNNMTFGLMDAFNTLRIMKEAPVIIVTLNIKGTSPYVPIEKNARTAEICDLLSIGASIENMLLAAQSLGLGTLWIANTFFAYRELIEYLETDSQLVGAVAVGYADEAPNARPRKSLEEIAEFRW